MIGLTHIHYIFYIRIKIKTYFDKKVYVEFNFFVFFKFKNTLRSAFKMRAKRPALPACRMLPITAPITVPIGGGHREIPNARNALKNR